jgi:hypothetical protein|tara:strand:- start:264 stop:479 length:216 start_codon:yes stop_codon:yes gene_type:complete
VKNERKNTMFNLTQKAADFFLNIGHIFSNDSTDTDVGVKSFCQSEYGKDWYWAYNSYKIDGRFPTVHKIRK